MTSYIKIWKPISVNQSNRPVLESDEHDIYVRDGVGIYQGKSKILNRQDGRIYLTNKRIIYFDNKINSNSCCVYLSDLSHSEPIARFLRSSPKVKLFLKNGNLNENAVALGNSGATVATGSTSSPSPPLPLSATPSLTSLASSTVSSKPARVAWTCQICSYNNADYFTANQLDTGAVKLKCASCGIPPSINYVKRFLTAPTKVLGDTGGVAESSVQSGSSSSNANTRPKPNKAQCPRCTFINHASLTSCEICGSPLPLLVETLGAQDIQATSKSSSSYNTNNVKIEIEDGSEAYTNNRAYIKVSFRKGGGEIEFNDLVNSAIEDIKWDELTKRGGVNENAVKINQQKPIVATGKAVRAGISGLEVKNELTRKTNEIVLQDSLYDLDLLMFKFEDIMKITESFKPLLKQNTLELSHRRLSTNSIIPELNTSRKSNIYHEELSRHLSEYLDSYELVKQTSMITTQDLFANYNRYITMSQGFGTDLISAMDFNKAVSMFDTLRLPMMLRKYERSGLIVVVRRSEAMHDNFIALVKQFLMLHQQLKSLNFIEEEIADEEEVVVAPESSHGHARGCNINEISQEFSWSYNITIEEMERCIESGTVLVDHHISGTFYFVNDLW